MDKAGTPGNGSQRLQAAIDEFNNHAGQSYQLSMSVGVEDLPAAGSTSLEALLSEADRAMYGKKREQVRRKENKRNGGRSRSA